MRLIKGCKRLNARAAAAALADAGEPPLGRAVIDGEAHVALRELFANGDGSDRLKNEPTAVRNVSCVGQAAVVEEGGGVKARSQDFPGFELSISSNEPYVRCALKEGWESLHYLEKTPLTVLELETAVSCKLTTEIRWEN